MGVNLKDLLERTEITIEQLTGKTLAVDAYNTLYQFLTTIRTPDGQLLTNKQGNITSHLIGLFSKTTNLLSKNIKLIFVFDGKPPELKLQELHRRAEAKKTAEQKYEQAEQAHDIASMRKYAARTTRLDKTMIEDAKTLLTLLGIPIVQAPSEGEAQCAHIAKKGHAWAVASQDYDSLLHGTPRLLQNLTISGKRKTKGALASTIIQPSILQLQQNLTKLNITQDQLIYLAMLIGTDYNPKGIHGIGPKKAYTLIKENQNPEQLFKKVNWTDHFNISWKELYTIIKTIPVTDDYTITFKQPNEKELIPYLVNIHDFNEERVRKSIEPLKKQQQALASYFT